MCNYYCISIMLDSHYRDQAAYHNNGKYKNRISYQDLKFLYILFFDNGHDKIKIVDRILYHNFGSNISKYLHLLLIVY